MTEDRNTDRWSVVASILAGWTSGAGLAFAATSILVMDVQDQIVAADAASDVVRPLRNLAGDLGWMMMGCLLAALVLGWLAARWRQPTERKAIRTSERGESHG